MKVLFAVSSESISEAIIKRYQKEYKEILSYKNVYYFNAILKEIQKDKTYDRIVISEDLEPFSNNNYDTIDKFIFEKLDSISDEAHDNQGKEASIILICTDRRVKGNSILVKLFGIGVYNALLGNDRSMDEVCRLIKQPRTKKEAKTYYRIDSEDVNYKAENENEVSEVEIQNILAHFKKLGKNTAKYSESFNNIAVQYTDEQLRIIVNCLPINVKAVLESECQRYQELMSATGKIPSVRGMVNSSSIEGIAKNEINQKIIGHAENMSRPVVIPSAVRSVKTSPAVSTKPAEEPQRPVQRPVVRTQVVKPQEEPQENIVRPTSPNVRTNMVARPQNPIKQEQPIEEDLTEELDDNMMFDFDELEEKENVMSPIQNNEVENFDLDSSFEVEELESVQEPRRGRGRPKKTHIEGVEVKPKGKRGRPRKIVEQPEPIEEIDEEVSLPGLDDLNSYNDEIEYDSNDIQDYSEDQLLPGFEDVEDNSYSSLEDFDEANNEYDNTQYTEEQYDQLGEEDYTEEVSLPGLDDLDDDMENMNTSEDGIELDEFGNEYEDVTDDGLLPGIGNDEYEEEETLLPGMGFEDEEDTIIPQKSISNARNNSPLESIRPKVDYSMSSLNSLITKDKKIVTFIGTSKNGNSFLVNNLAALFSSLGINTAILDMTKNKNSYFIFTKNEEELRTLAHTSIEKLQNGYAEGVKVDKNLTVYTDVPNSGKDYSNAEPILSTLVQNHSLILIDCDYDTDISYFASCQEMYLVQSMDILTIQPLTAFLRELKTKGVLEPEKIRVVINKEMKIHKRIGNKDIIGGLSYYNDPAMSFMTELFNKDTVKAISIPFDANAYARYLGGIVDCEVSLHGYSKQFLSKLKLLGDMVYPLTSKQTYSSKTGMDYNPNAFSNSMNDTLSKMRKKY